MAREVVDAGGNARTWRPWPGHADDADLDRAAARRSGAARRRIPAGLDRAVDPGGRLRRSLGGDRPVAALTRPQARDGTGAAAWASRIGRASLPISTG